MPRVVPWDTNENKKSGGQFLKLEVGKKYKIRLIMKAVEYFQHFDPVACRSPGGVPTDPNDPNSPIKIIDPLMLQGFTPKKRYACWVMDRDDGNKLKVMDFPPSLHDIFSEWRTNTPDSADPGGVNGPDWVITLKIPPGGNKRMTKYYAQSLERSPLSEEEVKHLKSLGLPEKLNELRKENTPEEIRQKLAEKTGEPTEPEAPPQAPVRPVQAPQVPQVPQKPSAAAPAPGKYEF
jgi:hypothetical protein